MSNLIARLNYIISDKRSRVWNELDDSKTISIFRQNNINILSKIFKVLLILYKKTIYQFIKNQLHINSINCQKKVKYYPYFQNNILNKIHFFSINMLDIHNFNQKFYYIFS